MNSVSATMQMFERAGPHASWRAVAAPEPAVIGRTGMAWSRFFLRLAHPGEPIKVEHDKSAPAGIYHTRATVLSATAQLDNGDSTSACQALTPDLGRSVTADSTLMRQFDVVSKTCAARAATASAATTIDSSAATARHDSAAGSANKRGDAATVLAAPIAGSDTTHGKAAKPATPRALSSIKP